MHDKVRKLYEEDNSISEIARILNLTYHQVHYIIKKPNPDSVFSLKRQINYLQERVEELEDDSIESKIRKLDKIKMPQELYEAFMRAKMKAYKANEILTDILIKTSRN